MAAFTPIAGSYSNHIGGGMTHPVTGAVYFLVTFRANSQGAYRLQVWEDQPPHGDPKMIREWATGTTDAGPGPWGYGTCTWMPNGSLYVIAPGGVAESNTVQPAIHIEPNLFPPIPLGSTGAVGTDPNVAAAVNQLQTIASQQQQAIETLTRSSAQQAQTITALELAIGTPGGDGGLSLEQQADLRWLSALRQLLRT